MDYLLDAVEVRVLGALIEKQILTPDYYPLTLNSLLIACNQKTARNPVTDYGENEIISAIDGLSEKGLAVQLNIAGSRAVKYRHRLGNFAESLSDKEVALLCVLLLRGPQTVGELRQRSERLYPFVDLAETEETLKKLAEWGDPEPLVALLPLAPGCKENRYVHLFSDIPATSAEAEVAALPRVTPSQVLEKMETLESVVEELKNAQKVMDDAIKTLKEDLDTFKKQFE